LERTQIALVQTLENMALAHVVSAATSLEGVSSSQSDKKLLFVAYLTTSLLVVGVLLALIILAMFQADSSSPNGQNKAGHNESNGQVEIPLSPAIQTSWLPSQVPSSIIKSTFNPS